jgi:hypothetical protein
MKNILTTLFFLFGFYGTVLAAPKGSLYDPLYVVSVSTSSTVTGKTYLQDDVYFGVDPQISTMAKTGTFDVLFGVKAATAVISGATDISGAVTLNSTLDVDGNITAGAANYRSTFTATTGAQVWTGGLTAPTFNGAVVGGAVSGTTGQFTGDFKAGAANFISTFTATTGQVALGGAFLMKSKTLAELDALAGVVGAAYYCSDCTNTAVCVGSGTAAGAWVDFSSPTVHCNTVK